MELTRTSDIESLVYRLSLFCSCIADCRELGGKLAVLLYYKEMPISPIKRSLETIRSELSWIRPAFWLLRWLEHTKRNRIEKSRRCLNKAIGLNAREEFIFTKPIEAIQLGGEGKHDEALFILREVGEDHKDSSDHDEQYVRYFCKFYECLYTEGGSCETFALEARKLDCSKSVRNFLKFPDQTFLQQYRQREEQKPTAQRPSAKFDYVRPKKSYSLNASIDFKSSNNR